MEQHKLEVLEAMAAEDGRRAFSYQELVRVVSLKAYSQSVGSHSKQFETMEINPGVFKVKIQRRKKLACHSLMYYF